MSVRCRNKSNEPQKAQTGFSACRSAVTVIGAMLTSFASLPLWADLDFTETLDPTTLVNQVIDPAQSGIVINSVTVFGGNGQIATFTNGLSVPGFIDFEEGIVLSSGQISSLTGPNAADGTGTNEPAIAGADGDPDFNSLTSAPQGTFDAAYIEIDFTPSQDLVRGSFVFASDEYNEYAPPAGASSAGNTYYDVMAFFVNGVNRSITASGENVSINTINETLNAADFNSNDREDDGIPTPVNIEADGFTRKLTWTAEVTPGVSNTLKFGVADGGDATYNSWLLVDKYAFEVAPAPTTVDLTLQKTDNTTAVAVGEPLVYEFSVGNIGAGPTGREITVVDTLPPGVTVNGGLAEALSETGPNASEWTCQSDAGSPQTVTCKSTVLIQTGSGNDTSVFSFSTDPIDAALDGNTLLNSAVVSTTDVDSNNANDTASDSTLVTTTDVTAPTVNIVGAPGVVDTTAPFTVTIDFNENVTGFTASDLSLTNAVASNLVAIDGSTFTLDVTPNAAGDVVMSVPTNAAQDSAGNNNDASNTSTVLFNSNAVELSLLNVPAFVASQNAYTVQFEFNEDVLGFTIDDINVVDGNVSNFVALDNNSFTADITPDGTGDIVISVLDAAATDSAGLDPTLAAGATTIYNISSPTVEVTGAPDAVNTLAAYPITVQFSEAVSDFIDTDIVVTNGTVSNFVAVDADTYTASVTPTGVGDVLIDIPISSATDVAGNGNQASDTVTTLFDNVDPDVLITGVPALINSVNAIPVTFEFTETVTGFAANDVVVSNGTLSNFTVIDGNTYTADITPDGVGNVAVSIAAAVAQDLTGNDNTLSQAIGVYDDVPPTLSINTVALDNIINALEDDSPVTVSGTSAGLENGQAVVVSINNIDYATTALNNAWSIDMPAADAQALASNETITVNASDLAGNAATPATLSIVHDATAPTTPTVTTVLTNNVAPVISGTATITAGDVLTVEVDGVEYTAGDGFLVDNGNGTWQLSVPGSNSIADGTYSVVANVTDTAGNIATDVSNNELEVDTAPPATPLVAVDLATADDSGSSNTDNNTNVSAGSFSVPSGTVTAGDTVTLYANGAAAGSVAAAADGSFTLSSSSLVDGNYAIRYTVSDAAGNESALSPTLSITVDTVTNVPTIASPIAIDGTVNSDELSSLVVEGTAETGSSVEITFDDGVNTPVVITVVTDNTGDWTLLGNEANLSSLDDGPISVNVQATDIAGNVNNAVPVNVTLDATAPVVPVVTALVSNDTTPTLTGTVSLQAGDEFIVVLNGVSYPETGPDLTDNGDGTWQLTVPAGNALTQALYEVVATVTDAAGNASTDIGELELEIDVTPPAVPEVQPLVSSSSTPTITGYAVVGSGESLAVAINGVTYNAGSGDLIDNGDGTWALTIPAGNALPDTTYEVVATVTDAAGNAASDASTNELLIDTVPPAVPTVATQTTNVSTPVITGTATLGAGDVLSVEVNTVTYSAGDGSLVDNLDGTWTLTIPPANTIADGAYNVDVTVTDAAGNSSTDTGSGELTVDTTAPATPTVAPNLIAVDDSGDSDTDNITSVVTPTLDVPAGTGVSGDTVNFFANGVGIGSTTVSPDGSFSVTASSLTDGTYAITYTLTDSTGNASAASPALNITIDSASVVPVIATPIESDNIVNVVEDDNVLIEGTAESDSTVLVSVSDGVNPPVQQSVVTDGDGSWSLLGSELNLSTLNDGVLTIDATATDVAGNVASAVSVSVDHETVLPTISIAAVTGDNLINAVEDDSDVTVSGTTTNVENGQTVFVTLNGKTYTALVASNAWSLTVPAIDIQVLTGSQLITADVQNVAENEAVQATLSITHDTTIPEVFINAVSGDDIINALEDNVDVVVDGTSTDLEDGQDVTVTVNGISYTGSVSANAWSVTLPAADAQALPVSNTLTANAADLAGNAAVTVSKDIFHDVIAPVVSIAAASTATGANSTNYVVGGSCTTGDNAVTVSITSATPASQSALCNASSEWSATFDVSAIADGSGVIAINASQSDAAGNTAAATSVNADKNTSVPSITINVVAGDDYINAVEDDSPVVISGSTTDIEDNQVASIELNGITYNATVTSNLWSVSVPAVDAAALGVSELITADVSNSIGTPADQASRTVYHDDTAPTVPSVVSVLTNSGTPVITGTATVQAGDVLTATVNSETYTAGDGHLVDNGDGTWELTIPPEHALVEGIYDVTVSIVDSAGNSVSESTNSELEIDTSAPATPAIAPDLIVSDDSGSSDTDNETNVLAATFSVPAATGVSGNGVTLFADGVEIGTGSVQPDGSFSIATVLPGDGEHTITYSFTDLAGNESLPSTALTVTVDSTIETPSIDMPIETDNLVSALEDDDVLVTGTAEPGSTVEVSFDDSVNPPIVVTVTTAPNGVWSLAGSEANLSALEDGTITVDATSTDVAGNVASAVQQSIEHDATPTGLPVVTLLVTNTAVPVITGNATLAAGDTLTVEVNGVSYTAGAGQLLDNGDGTWTLSIPSQDSLADGVYSVTASITDAAGNVSVDATSDELEIDTVAPTSPTVVSQITSNSTPTVSGTVTLLGGETLSVVIDGNTYTVADELTVPGDGSWSVIVPAVDALLDGAYDVVATVTDGAGNVSSDTTTTELLIDTQLPAVPTVAALISDTATPVLTGTAVLQNGESLTVTVNGVNYNAGEGELVHDSVNSWVLTIPDVDALPDANYEVTASVTDLAGNNNVDVSALELTVDTTSPVIPTVTAQSSASGTPVIIGTATLAAGESLTVTVAGVDYPDTGSDLTVNGNGTWTLTIPAPNSLAQATYNVTATVTDAAGNASEDNSSSELLIDFSVPSTPTVDSLTTNNVTPTVTGTAVVQSGETLTVTLDGQTYSVGADLTLNGQNWSLTVPAANLLSDGTYSVTANVSDTAGNNADDSSTDELLIDTVAPTIAIQAIAGDNIVNAAEDDSSVLVSGTTTGVEDNQLVAVQIAGITYQATVLANAWSVSIPASDVQAFPTNVNVLADVSDIAGNAAVTATQTVQHDTEAPAVSINNIPLISAANAAAFEFGGTCSVGEGDVSVTASAGTPANQTVSCLPDGTWSATIDASALADGSGVVSIDAVQTDSAGNASVTASSSTDKDTEIPTIVITDAGDNGNGFYDLTEALSVQIVGTTVGVADFGSVTVTFDDGTTELTTTATVSSNGWTADPLDITGLDQGLITVTATVSDAVGNDAVPAVENVTLDTAVPLITASNYGPGVDSTPLLSGTTDLPDTTAVVVEDSAGTLICNAIVSSGAWSCESLVTLAEGTTSLVAKVSDVAGNDASAVFNAVIDSTLDSDGDGIDDLTEGTGDSDGDSIPDYLDTDSDNDGINDNIETSDDADGDGIANYLDLDSDNDTITDSIELDTDADNDSVPDFLDLDSDNDGVTDLAESGASELLDANADGRADGVTGANGLLDEIETALESGVADYTADGLADAPADTDADGVEDYIDLDSDNDGVADVVEAGGVQGSDTGVLAAVIDTNGDGLHDALISVPLDDPDTDNDGVVDRLSLDSDADGISDIVEAGGTDANDDGLIDNLLDVDANGLQDALQNVALPDTDSDADLLPDRIDTDSDGDGIDDSVETNLGDTSIDTDSDGVPDYLDLDSDADGLSDADEGVADIDNDSIPDYIDNNALADTDGDGILDSEEGLVDTDGDGVPNLNDTDSDGDGIDDSDETNADTDNDGIPNYIDTDSDNDGIPDDIEGDFDTDDDGNGDYLDTDSDGDGILDSIEVGSDPLNPVDTDLDGDADYFDFDSDNDSIDDAVETGADTDGDGIANYLDLDSDGDGIADAVELDTDPDGDGVLSVVDLDSDGDGILDSVEGGLDTDNDGVINALDLDSDGDGIDDAEEGTVDTDGDGILNYLDTDSDNDGVPDGVETNADADGDSVPNYLDIDSDADGLADSLEVGPVPNQPIDTNMDGIPNFLSNDSDADGIPDSVEGVVDTDNDGLANYIDVDSDGDGIPDSVEGVVDTDGDGSPNYLDLDSDADNVNDVVEAGLVPATPQDTDNDQIPDYLDEDSDNDNISDLIEGHVDSDGDGIPNLNDSDSNGDGLPDIVAGPADTDGDGVPDYLDADIDGDGLSNTTEGAVDTDGDGIANYLDTDSDGDGIPDIIELGGDADGDSDANYVDTDSDGDGISDQFEAGADPLLPADTDGDGTPDFLDDDADGDGIPDSVETSVDTDGDLIPDFLDSDADGDGIADVVEGVIDSDGDGTADYVDTDSDGDGIGDELEGNVDTDGDQVPNYLDLDSDADQILDAIESSIDSDADGIADYLDFDSDGDGIPDVIETNDDADGDGLGNYIDLDSDGDGATDSSEAGVSPETPIDTDADNIPDFLDLDSDGDGISDIDEGIVDSDGDGLPDARDDDSNNDGILDVVAGDGDFDLDGIPNFLDDDIDGDGIPNSADGLGDADGDDIANYFDTDSDNDGIDDALEGDVDLDGDGLPNFIDTDSDGDGLTDVDEGLVDSDGDLLPDYIDTDSDNDLIPDVIEQDNDSDADGILDYLDPDSDNDGVLDVFESSDDIDSDGIPNYQDSDSDGDGIPDNVEAGPGDAGTLTPPVDSDMDGVFDFLDTDSDGDNISDAVETIADTDADGVPNYLDGDSDGDGIADVLEKDDDTDADGVADYLDTDADGDSIPDEDEGTIDTDSDGVPNFIDTDADGDSIPDAVETDIDTDADGIPDYLDLDSDSDGVADVVEAGADPLNPVDTDNDSAPDYVDSDSDNDGVSDLDEGVDDLDGDGTPNLQDPDDNNDGIPDVLIGPGDTDGDGIPDTIDNDIDGDGIDNSSEGLGDTDGDGIANFLDTDSDGDGIDDAVEGVNDLEGDGVPNYLDTDSDGDGIADSVESDIDSDADGNPNYLDLDSDADGVPDALESNTDADFDGEPNYLDQDSDGDSIPDSVELFADADDDGLPNFLDLDSDNDTINDVVEAGADPTNPIDTDADGLADFVDTDSDNDGIDDSNEGITDSDGDGIPNATDLDSNNDGIPDAEVGPDDLDGDGIPDFLDADVDGDGIANALDGLDDPDLDGTPNFLDSDSDGDGIPDADELSEDTDGDGIPNFLDLDSDNDSILDSDEDQFDTDGDGIPNYIDADSDNDGIPDSVELGLDTGEDGVPNYIDTDSDDDGLPDAEEGITDFDADGLPNYLDDDSDGDGIADGVEGLVDSDLDGVDNYLDDDSDGDGIADAIETGDDTDNDGVQNFVDLDSDGDGINDSVETDVDSDSDGLADFIDTDSDNDGISDAEETVLDSDADGIPNYLDEDSDADTVPDSIEGIGDTDGDGIANYLDTDADGDGIDDIVEGSSDTDGDGIADSQDTDSDGDGISDSVEVGADTSNPVDSDEDGIPDFQDPDSDNDGIGDGSEGVDDNDGDGIPNNLDPDSNNDGIPDALVGDGDIDEDGVADFLDADIDGDGIPNAVEGIADSDGDGVGDFIDTDSDNDGIDDAIEGIVDTDGDGVADYLDIDSDNDQIADVLEQDIDTDSDGIPNYIDTDSDADGIDDLLEGTIDSDGDGLPNSIDTDSDGDGIPDSVEGVTDVDNDGVPNYLDLDSDGDGVGDSVEAGSDANNPVDSDADSSPDFLDLDSDDDGVPDSASPDLDSDGDGIIDELDQDDNNDGILDTELGNNDTDGDGIADSMDNDVDGDGIPNTEENTSDSDGDGIPDYLDTDSDNDGIDDAVEGTGDTDGDGIPDFQDTDSDGDGIHDSAELGDDPLNPLDSDGDGVPDYSDQDSDGDGIIDSVEGIGDTDDDGIPDYLDTDSDGDGIPDEVEQNIDTDDDGAPDYVDLDADGDGINDVVEAGVTADPSTPVDSDGDGVPDYLDTDSDNDGIADTDEGVTDSDGDGIDDSIDTDANNDGIEDGTLSDVSDLDGDGIPDAIDSDVDGDGIPNTTEGTDDSDGDGIADFMDTDSDGDGIGDDIESTNDSDGDGILDYLDTDSDGDGIDDIDESNQDSDGDGIPNYLDLDVDGDGIVDSVETDVDSDGDGTPDYNDDDSDNDGISDADEGALDSDDDGIPNFLDTDSDNDGIDDTVEGITDSDGDGVVDALDVDSDADGISDDTESTADTDGDSIPDYLDTDSDNDNVPDVDEGDIDSDGDGTPDYIDTSNATDSDNDGILDSEEGTDDTDGDGIPNYLDTDSDGDGIPDADETNVDSDGDGIPNYIDTDSDQDGIPDQNEGTDDTDGDGVPDYIDLTTTNNGGTNPGDNGPQTPQTDTDGDGVIDALDGDSDNDGIPDSLEAGVDSDSDGIDDSLDLDSDNDGITDAQEAAQQDEDGDGRIDNFTDNNSNGIHDAFETSPVVIPDTDNDNVPDYLDSDSDQDGVPDLVEMRGTDQNNDAYIDAFVDANGDGLDDSLLVAPTQIVDSDGDGIGDHLELDSDNDGISDLSETGGVDADGDGVVDSLLDTDSDGIPDAVDVDVTGGIDADQDGIADFADADFVNEPDQDNDGIIDRLDADANGDGFADNPGNALSLGAALPDTDGDDIPNFQQAESDLPVKTGIYGNGVGCSVADRAELSRGVDPLFGLMFVMSVLVLFFRQMRLHRQRLLRKHLELKVRFHSNTVVAVCVATGCLLALQPAYVAAQSASEPEFKRSSYVGFGAGVSMLNPDTEGSIWEVSESSSVGFQGTLGMDFSKWFTGEVHFSVLGEAGLQERANANNKDTISYQIGGASVLGYLASYDDQAEFIERSGPAAYLRAGIGFMNNSSTSVNMEQTNAMHFLVGLGAEYAMDNGLGVRAEVIGFDGDAQYAQLGLIYRFGKTNTDVEEVIEEPEPTVIATDKVVPKPAPKPIPKPKPKPLPKPIVIGDDDGDGVNNNLDKCPGSLPGKPIGVDGCEIFNGVLEGVNFETGSAKLTTNAKRILDKAASELRKFETVNIRISAHTDDQGDDAYNLDLSRQRVVAVANYLASKGVAKSRMAGSAFGERKPLVSNATPEGRARNRRVEITQRK